MNIRAYTVHPYFDKKIVCHCNHVCCCPVVFFRKMKSSKIYYQKKKLLNVLFCMTSLIKMCHFVA